MLIIKRGSRYESLFRVDHFCIPGHQLGFGFNGKQRFARLLSPKQTYGLCIDGLLGNSRRNNVAGLSVNRYSRGQTSALLHFRGSMEVGTREPARGQTSILFLLIWIEHLGSGNWDLREALQIQNFFFVRLSV